MKKSFTLLELLVVIIVIGILAAIAVPQYLKAANKAKLASVYSTVGSLKKKLRMYAALNSDLGDNAWPYVGPSNTAEGIERFNTVLNLDGIHGPNSTFVYLCSRYPTSGGHQYIFVYDRSTYGVGNQIARVCVDDPSLTRIFPARVPWGELLDINKLR